MAEVSGHSVRELIARWYILDEIDFAHFRGFVYFKIGPMDYRKLNFVAYRMMARYLNIEIGYFYCTHIVYFTLRGRSSISPPSHPVRPGRRERRHIFIIVAFQHDFFIRQQGTMDVREKMMEKKVCSMANGNGILIFPPNYVGAIWRRMKMI